MISMSQGSVFGVLLVASVRLGADFWHECIKNYQECNGTAKGKIMMTTLEELIECDTQWLEHKLEE